MNRQQIEAIEIGQAGLYSWNPTLRVVRVEPVQEVSAGRHIGRAFRYVEVVSETGNGTIGFTVQESR